MLSAVRRFSMAGFSQRTQPACEGKDDKKMKKSAFSGNSPGDLAHLSSDPDECLSLSLQNVESM